MSSTEIRIPRMTGLPKIAASAVMRFRMSCRSSEGSETIGASFIEDATQVLETSKAAQRKPHGHTVVMQEIARPERFAVLAREALAD
jgi:hypothetical protein